MKCAINLFWCLVKNNEDLETKWNIGRLLVEAQGGESRAKYGNGLIKEWSKDFTEKYGNGYSITNLKRYRQFYIAFQKGAPVAHQLTWSHYIILLPLKNENERNYYINLCITHNLSKRELIKEIKSNSYNRLLDKPEKIEIITNQTENYNIKEHIKNPIIITLNKDEQILKEKDLQTTLLAKLKNFFSELGLGYTFVGNEYKIHYGNKNYFIDILLFNVETNSYVVVELKTRELRKEDKSQIEFYLNIIDNTLKRNFHNKTLGILITKHQDKYIATFINNDNITSITYKINYTWIYLWIFNKTTLVVFINLKYNT